MQATVSIATKYSTLPLLSKVAAMERESKIIDMILSHKVLYTKQAGGCVRITSIHGMDHNEVHPNYQR